MLGNIECKLENFEALTKFFKLFDLSNGPNNRYVFLYGELLDREKLFNLKKQLVAEEHKQMIKNDFKLLNDVPLTLNKFLWYWFE